MQTITISGRQYPVGELTVAKALALADFWAAIQQDGKAKADATGKTPGVPLADLIRRAAAVLRSFGCDPDPVPVAELVNVVSGVLELASVQWAPGVSRDVVPALEQLHGVCHKIALELAG
jgi:hypothetical protein